jgi:hypothetical protein
MTRLLAAFLAVSGRIVLALGLATATVPALADEDLPSRAGRLADVAGRVFLATEERAEDWLEALRNYTITSGDNLWVAGDGRAEIDYGGGQFRLAGDTNVHVARLDDRTLALFVAQGRVIVRVRVLDPGESALVDTPNTQVALTRPGLYRIEVAPDRTRTEVVVRQGEALVQLAAGTQQVLPGQTATVAGTEAVFADVRTGYWVDGFDSWSAERDRRYERSRSASYVSPQMVGHADLDEFGSWQTVPEYGAVWFPTTVAVGWAPYRFGRWSWVGGWGWTWVDDAPWGYAPFHYGRWGFIGGRWGWAPGGFVARPVWSPAMVAWYGGGGWSFSVSFGAPVFGWVPLGWGEPYMPWWRGCSDRCWTMYNRPYAVNYAERPHAPPTRYRNWSAPGGVTAVAGATFTGRQPVHRNLVDVKPQLVSAAPMLAQAPVVAKPTAATIPGAKPATAAVPPPAAHFYRTKPMQASPGASGVTPPGQGPRPGTTWGGGASAAPATAQPGAASGAARVPSGQAARPDSTWVDGGRRTTSAPPATAKQPVVPPREPAMRPAPSAASPSPSGGRAPQATPNPQGTWGTPTAPAPGYEPRSVTPSSPAPMPRAAPPSQGVPRSSAPPPSQGVPRSSAPPPSQGVPRSSAPPPSQGVPRSSAPPPSQGMPRPSAPPASAGPAPTRPAPEAAPAPRSGSGGPSDADKPAPRGKGPKPGEGQ